jgi:hypothetical protein
MVAVGLPDFTVCVSVLPFIGAAANAVPAVMHAPTANKAMVFIVPPLLVWPADADIRWDHADVDAQLIYDTCRIQMAWTQK